MLKIFKTKNFKMFKDEIVFDLSKINNYEFNSEAVQHNTISKGLIYGINGCGKSNLGLAIFDITLHLTDKQKRISKYNHYLNLDSEEKYASFYYKFEFEEGDVVYSYQKTDAEELKYEELIINNTIVLEYDFVNHKGFVSLPGTETLMLENDNSMISRVKFLKSNAILKEGVQSRLFQEFILEVDRMLLFYSLQENSYLGFTNGSGSISSGIIENNKLKEFEEFLNKVGVKLHLIVKTIDGEPLIYCKYKEGEANFFQVASTGTRSLALFYYWYIQISKASFVFIDEFDAFYHFELSDEIVRKLLEVTETQIILTTHNTDLMTNALLRPDCYFELQNGKLKSFAESTNKELRQAHNIQKMYKAGAFNEE
ncbi:MAG: ATP-binding protein [Hespellia sp.]|nr:ATP-binding protein [Hespellia sp.]